MTIVWRGRGRPPFLRKGHPARSGPAVGCGPGEFEREQQFQDALYMLFKDDGSWDLSYHTLKSKGSDPGLPDQLAAKVARAETFDVVLFNPDGRPHTGLYVRRQWRKICAELKMGGPEQIKHHPTVAQARWLEFFCDDDWETYLWYPGHYYSGRIAAIVHGADECEHPEAAPLVSAKGRSTLAYNWCRECGAILRPSLPRADLLVGY